METIEGQLVPWLPKLAMAIAILFCFWVISKLIQTALRKSGDRFNLKEPFALLFLKWQKSAFWFLALLPH